MTAIEMPLLRQAITNAFAILLLVILACVLIHRGFRRIRQLRHDYRFARSMNPGAGRMLLLRRVLETPSTAPQVVIVKKNPRCEAADAAISIASNLQHPRIRKRIRMLLIP